MNLTDTADLWWKTAVVYCADVQTFLDTNSDGIGDLRGMIHRVDYLAELGVTCLWLMPFYPSPQHDDGYDIVDFFGVDPAVGSPGDFVELVTMCRSRGIRVIIDLVVNHTSEQHPWFKESRSSTDNPRRDWYVWRSTKPRDSSKEVVFKGEEHSIWELDEKTGEYYLHHFYANQPDLNTANPEVRDEIARTMGYWLQLGVSGFRIDAVPFLSDDKLPAKDRKFGPFDLHHYLRELRTYTGRRVGDTMLLGEVNVPYADQLEFFGGADGDELTMQFDFVGMQAAYLSLVRHDTTPLVDALTSRPDVDPSSQWANFLRNHDELTLDKLSRSERKEVFDAFGPDPDMQLYDRGLRRRLPTMLGGDMRRIKMAYSLMFSIPGTPVLFYGEEIGMGENLDIPGRNAVRTPMQWGPGRNAGFSDAPANKLFRPLTTGPWGPESVNVSDLRNDPDSLLSFMRLLISRYRQSPEIGWSVMNVLEQPDSRLLAHLCTKDDWALLALHNFAHEPVEVEVEVPGLEEGAELLEMLSPGRATRIRTGPKGLVKMTMPAYGYGWWRVVREDDRRIG